MSKRKKIIIIIIVVVFILSALIGTIALLYHFQQSSDTIQSGVFIKNNNVSGLTREQAVSLVKNALRGEMRDQVNLIYRDIDYYVDVEQIEAKFNIEDSVEQALSLAKGRGFFENVSEYFRIMHDGEYLEPTLDYNEQALDDYIDGLQSQLPDQLEQSSYYVEDGKLIITNGRLGAGIEKQELKNQIIEAIRDISYSTTKLQIPTYPQYPDGINVGAIHDELYREVKNAYYTVEPRALYPEVIGVDFDIAHVVSVLRDNPNQDEWEFDLNYTYPETTIYDLGNDAFPNLLASFATKYVNNPNRTTNLRLAASKVNGTIVLPGETFSYNKTVGKRTVAAGYKEAAIYENGQVVDGVGGGICQISTTIYNAAVEANMEIVERRNHQFVPSYVSGGYDATVAWGSTDFQFKNTRDYPIKIEVDVSGGVASVGIYGLLTDDEYDISITTKTVKSTSSTLVVDSFKVYKRDGQVVNTEKLYRDTYKKH